MFGGGTFEKAQSWKISWMGSSAKGVPKVRRKSVRGVAD